MPDGPTFLKLPARAAKPRSRGITHVLDSGLTPDGTRAFLGQTAHLVDIVKVGWGIGYIDPTLSARVAICASTAARCRSAGPCSRSPRTRTTWPSCGTGPWGRHHPHRGVGRAARADRQPQA